MWVLQCVNVCVCVGGGGGGGGLGYCIFSWKRHIYDYNDRFDLWVDMGKFYLYLLRCCPEVPSSQIVSFYS